MNLLALLGGGKDKAKPSPLDNADAPSDGGPEDTYAREAFSALKDDDEEGFVTALLGAVRACKKKDYAAEDPTEPDADDAFEE